MLDETLDHRAQRSVLERYDRDWPRSHRQGDGQFRQFVAESVEAQHRTRECRDERAGGGQIGAKGNGNSPHSDLWHVEAACPKSLRHNSVIPAGGSGQNPWLVDEVRKVDLATARPSALHTGGNDQFVIEKNFHVHVVEQRVFRARPLPQVHQNEIETAIAQLRCERRKIRVKHIQNDARISFQEPLNDLRECRGCSRFGASELQLTGFWISQEFNASDALPQFIEYRRPAREQRTAIDGGLDAPRAAIEKPHPERGLQVPDRLGHGGLSDPEAPRCLRHAARLHDREEHM